MRTGHSNTKTPNRGRRKGVSNIIVNKVERWTTGIAKSAIFQCSAGFVAMLPAITSVPRIRNARKMFVLAAGRAASRLGERGAHLGDLDVRDRSASAAERARCRASGTSGCDSPIVSLYQA